MMEGLQQAIDLLVQVALPAALASGLVLLAATFLKPWRDLAVAPAIAAGMLAGNFWRQSIPFLPDGWGWPCLWASALAALAFGGIGSQFQRSLLRWGIMLAPTALASFCLLSEDLRTWPMVLGFGLAVTLVAAVLIGASDWQPVNSKDAPPPWVVPLVCVAVLLAAGLVLIYAHSARFFDAAILMAAALGGASLVATCIPLNMRSALPAVAIYLCGLMLSGQQNTYSEVPLASFVLIAAAPLGLLINWLPGFDRWPHWLQLSSQLALPLVTVVISVALAMWFEDLSLG